MKKKATYNCDMHEMIANDALKTRKRQKTKPTTKKPAA